MQTSEICTIQVPSSYSPKASFDLFFQLLHQPQPLSFSKRDKIYRTFSVPLSSQSVNYAGSRTWKTNIYPVLFTWIRTNHFQGRLGGWQPHLTKYIYEMLHLSLPCSSISSLPYFPASFIKVQIHLSLSSFFRIRFLAVLGLCTTVITMDFTN